LNRSRLLNYTLAKEIPVGWENSLSQKKLRVWWVEGGRGVGGGGGGGGGGGID
jgi:hypothetical protein